MTDAEAVRTMLLRLVDGRIAHRLRLEAGLTQDELAQRARVSRRTVGRLEDGEHVRPESAAQIAEALESLSPRGAGLRAGPPLTGSRLKLMVPPALREQPGGWTRTPWRSPTT